MKPGAEVEFPGAKSVVIGNYNLDAAFRQLARFISEARLVFRVKTVFSIGGEAAFVFLVRIRRIAVDDIAGYSLVHDVCEIIAVQLSLLQPFREPQQGVFLKIGDLFRISVRGIAFALPVGSVEAVETKPADIHKQRRALEAVGTA